MYNIVVLFFSCQAVQNLGLALISMVTGLIVDHYGFQMLEIFFIIWLGRKWKKCKGLMRMERNINCFGFLSISVSLVATLVIYLYDYNEKGILNMTPIERSNHPNNM